MGQVELLPGRGKDIAGPVGVEEIIGPHAQQRMIAEHLPGAAPEGEAEEGGALARIEQRRKARRPEERDEEQGKEQQRDERHLSPAPTRQEPQRQQPGGDP